jgi:hypothetical protein
MIFCSDIEVRNSTKKYVPFQTCTALWQQCGENDLKLPDGKGRLDPVLKLYTGCRVMLACNTNVRLGQANGTQATLEKVFLSPGQMPQEVLLDGSTPVKAVYANQVSYIVLRHCNERIQPPTFSIYATKHTFKANIPKPPWLQLRKNDKDVLQMKAVQFQMLCNNATTGHKLQGSGVDTLFVHNWSYSCRNWVYVMLSRVKTLAGLFVRMELSYDLSKYAVPNTLIKMLANFRAKAPTYWTDDEYDELFPHS